jgi:hypothetical protein
VLTVNVLVAASPPDIQAEGVAAAVANRDGMALVADRVLALDDVSARLESIPVSEPCALVLMGRGSDVEALATWWVTERAGLVVLRVDVIDDLVQIAVRDSRLELESLLNALRDLVQRAGGSPADRIAGFALHSGAMPPDEAVAFGAPARDRPLLAAAIAWIHGVLRSALPACTQQNGDLPGLTLTAATVADLLDTRAAGAVPRVSPDVVALDVALTRALGGAEHVEPLAAMARALRLTSLEFRMVLLALAPELDMRYQRCVGLLLDDLGRKVGTMGLYSALLGEPSQVRRDLAHAGNLARWRVLDARPGGLPAADEPLRVDAALAGWLLGERSSLDHDPRVRRLMRLTAWSGANLFQRSIDSVRATNFVTKLQTPGEVRWMIFAGDDPGGWRALLELGAELRSTIPVRVMASRLAGLDVAEIEESGARLGRLTRLTGRPLVVDVTGVGDSPQDDEGLRLLLAAIGGTGCRAGVIGDNTARLARLLGSSTYAVIDGTALHAAARPANIQVAAKVLNVDLDEATAAELARHYPLGADAVEQSMRLSRARQMASDDAAGRYERFLAACQDVAAEGASRLAERIDPRFRLEEVVLPRDRAAQLVEIVDNVRLAATVLDQWKFRDQLPYGRGVSALFHGPSGTGKTMAALGVAQRLGIQILRVDLSRVVSKYIGDTEKNIDRVFTDARSSGSAILIDEADALFGRRSEVKDAHDRYANIEVAYLLQRMESFDGLAILTTNLRQNLDPAFLRRLRFIVDFPRPDVEAREQIWRQCLPAASHTLDDAAFRQLARRIELTGGNIRQITVRAAFVAAARDSLIGLAHIDYAARAEFAKLGIPAVALELPEQRRAA